MNSTPNSAPKPAPAPDAESGNAQKGTADQARDLLNKMDAEDAKRAGATPDSSADQNNVKDSNGNNNSATDPTGYYYSPEGVNGLHDNGYYDSVNVNSGANSGVVVNMVGNGTNADSYYSSANASSVVNMTGNGVASGNDKPANITESGASAEVTSGHEQKGNIDDIAKALGSRTLDIMAIDTEGEKSSNLFTKITNKIADTKIGSKIVSKEYGRNMEEMARQAARERIEKERKSAKLFGEGSKGILNFLRFKTPLIKTINETYLFGKYRKESLKAMEETGQVYAGANGAEFENVNGRKVAKNAGDKDILERFEAAKELENEERLAGFDEKGIVKQSVSRHAGEKLETRNDDPVAVAVKGELAKLAHQLAADNSLENREAAKRKFDEQVKKWKDEKFLTGSNTSVDNLQEMGDKIFEKLNGHKFSTEAVDEYFDKKVNMNFGQANVGLRQREQLDGNAKLVAKFGLAGIAVGTVWKGGLRAIFGLGGLVMAPIYGGIRADTLAKQEQVKTEKGKTFDLESNERLNAEWAAEQLSSYFEEGSNKLRGNLSKEEREEFLNLVSIARAKQTLSDEKNVDLFSYKDMQSVERARTKLSKELARAMININRDDALNADFKKAYKEQFDSINAAVDERLSDYDKKRHAKIVKGALVGLGAGILGNLFRGAVDVASGGAGGNFLQQIGVAGKNIASGNVKLDLDTASAIGHKTIDNIGADVQKLLDGGIFGKTARRVAETVSANSISGNSVSGNGLGAQMQEAGLETGAIAGGSKQEVLMTMDKDGGQSIWINGKQIIGNGDEAGVMWDKNGDLTEESANRLNEALKANGFGELEKHVEAVPVKGEQMHSLSSFIAEQREKFEVFAKLPVSERGRVSETPLFEKIGTRTWDGDNNIVIGNPRIEGDEILIPVTGSDASGTELLLSVPGADDMGASLPVESDGFVHISMNSEDLDLSSHEGQVEAMAASMFNIDKSSNEVVFSGWKMEVGHNDDLGGGFEVMRTVMGQKDLASVSTFEDTVHNVTSYGIPVLGEASETTEGVEIVDGKQMFILKGENSASLQELAKRGVQIDQYDFDRVGMTAPSGETIGVSVDGESTEFNVMAHQNGYNYEQDPWATPVDRESLGVAYGESNTGASVVERAQNVVDGWTKSPEQLAQVRVMLGLGNESNYGDSLLYNDDSYLSLPSSYGGSIDSLDELNAYGEYIRSLSPEEYDKLVEQTLSVFYGKLQGGSIAELDYAKDPYELTSYMKQDSSSTTFNPISYFVRKIKHPNGSGTIFKDASGKNIFDSPEIRKIWGVKGNATKFEVSFRHQCGNQVVGDVAYPAPKVKVNPQPQPVPPVVQGQPQPVTTIITQETGVENTGTENEGTGNEGTGHEGTGHEGTGHEGTGNEGTGNEGTGDEGTGTEDEDVDTGTEGEGKGPDAHSGGEETQITSPEDGHVTPPGQPEPEYVPSTPGGDSPQGDAPISSDGDGSASDGYSGDSSQANPASAGGDDHVQSGDDLADRFGDRVNHDSGTPEHSDGGGDHGSDGGGDHGSDGGGDHGSDGGGDHGSDGGGGHDGGGDHGGGDHDGGEHHGGGDHDGGEHHEHHEHHDSNDE